MNDNKTAQLIVRLLEQVGTKEPLQQLLKSKGCAFSGSWDELREKRVIQAIDERLLDISDLLALLQSVEEHGRQHVFLYEIAADKAKVLMDRSRVIDHLKVLGCEHLVSKPRILDQPDEPTLVDVRWISEKIDLYLIVKEIETRQSFQPLDESTDTGRGILTKRYQISRDRVVNLIQLHHDGLLEIRISSRTTGTQKYKEDLKGVWARVKGLFNENDFKPIPLFKIKRRIVSEQEKLSDILRFSNSELRNADGTRMSVSSRGPGSSLYDDNGASKGINEFLKFDGYSEGSNFFFVKNSDLSKDVHVWLSGEINEFAITASCDKGDYEYVLDKIRILNK